MAEPMPAGTLLLLPLWLLPGLARGAQLADVKSDPFPTGEVLVLAGISLAIAFLVAALASWKSGLVEGATGACFDRAGRLIAGHPLKFLAGSLLAAGAMGSGFTMIESEVDPTKLWVPAGSASSEHMHYVDTNWPAGARPVLIIARAEQGGSGTNMLTPARLQSFQADLEAMLDYIVDGDDIVQGNTGAARDRAQKYAGRWTFDGRGGTQHACYQFSAGTCGLTSVLAVFGHNATLLAQATPEVIRDRLALWEAAPKNSIVPGLGLFKSFELADVLGDLGRDSAGRIVSAEVAMLLLFFTNRAVAVVASAAGQEDVLDPVIYNWEANAACHMGLTDQNPEDKQRPCSSGARLTYTALLQRSFDDEFGNAIAGDISMVIIAYVLIITYLNINLGRRDKVHSMVALSAGVLAVIGVSYVSSTGLGGLFGIKTNPLNANIPFLLVGLGVDDAFVLVAEFVRHSLAKPEISIEERCGLMAKSGGLSVLVTSLTDGLAFLIGASTQLPALSAFCIYAGLAVIFCFVFTFTVFVPLMALNARRAEANRYDVLCCFKARQEHRLQEPQGCLGCIPGCGKLEPKEAVLPRVFGAFARVTVKTLAGRLVTGLVFLGMLAGGLAGMAQLKKEFKRELFFPADSYVQDFFTLNRRHFSKGNDFAVYTNGVDLFSQQANLNEMSDYFGIQTFLVDNATEDLWLGFSGRATPATDRAQFWQSLWSWYAGPGARHEGAFQWTDSRCNGRISEAVAAGMCDPTRGIAHATILRSTLKYKEFGNDRYETYRTMREDIKDMFGLGPMAVFPYDFEFLFWEENGIIDSELARNLIIASSVIIAIIAILIPKPRIAGVVALNIVAAITEVIGFAHHWGVRMNGISTIYFLFCAGLAVDYSAHIGHAFRDAQGKAEDRAVDALVNIGPSVWNASFSTFLAVVVLGFSASFVFEVFFKVLFLVTVIAGAHGIWLLPTLLALLGGDSQEPPAKPNRVADDDGAVVAVEQAAPAA
mmetsp:Transcript_89707/g.254130  ORF Transcript_89707/g.254130 Transcript_89707/m.254130 type:complete len:992 (+) Transcript_89707:100-3075(+)